MILTADDTREALRALQRGRRTRRLRDLDWIEVAYKAYIAAIVSFGNALHRGRDRRRHRPEAEHGRPAAHRRSRDRRARDRRGHHARAPLGRPGWTARPRTRRREPRTPRAGRPRGRAARVGLPAGPWGRDGRAGRRRARRPPHGPAHPERVRGRRRRVDRRGRRDRWRSRDRGVGSALVASGRRWGRVLTAAIGVVLVAWSLLDVFGGVVTSPASMLGTLAFWPLVVRPIALVGVVCALAIPVIGLLGIGDTSIEAAERRSGLVGALRFAATIQDLRTVIVLHRQLAQERSRQEPWLALPRAKPIGHACWRRDWQGVLRWPISRVGRVAALGAVAGTVRVRHLGRDHPAHRRRRHRARSSPASTRSSRWPRRSTTRTGSRASRWSRARCTSGT